MTERIRLLDDLGAQFARVAADAERPARKPRVLRAGVRARALPVAFAMLAMLAGTAYAVPTTRGLVDGITGPLAAWVTGSDGSAPGRPVAAGDNTPRWFQKSDSAGVRVIAETDGVGLYVQRFESDRGPMLQVSLGQGLGMSNTLAGWRQQLSQHTVYILGDALFGSGQGVIDDRGRVPFFGLTTRNVKRVEVRYADGTTFTSDNGDGGFVLLVDAWRPMRELVAYDATGQMLDRIDVSKYDLRYLCEKEPGCPATR